MVNSVPKKKKAGQKSTFFLKDTLFKALFFCIYFFISIGENTRQLILAPTGLKRPLNKVRSSLKKIPIEVMNYFKKISHVFKLKRTDSSKKETKVRTVAVASLKKAQILKKEKRKFPALHLPKLPKIQIRVKIPHIKFALPFKLPTRSVSKSLKKINKRTKSGLKSSNRTISKFLVVFFKALGRFLKKTIQSLAKFVWFLIRITGRLLKNILIFLALLIIRPLQFIYSLFTVQLRFFLLGALICAIFFIGRELHQFVQNLASPKDIGKVNYSLATHLYDRNGELLYEIYRDAKRTPIKISDLPYYVPEAAIAIEDKDFYQHKGVSLISGVLRAFKENLSQGNLQGGSTITQQLVKTALLTPERTITRKAKEIILALWTEQMYSKEHILEMYHNQVAYGGAAYGIQEAAKTYFGKDAKNLSIAEAALLAGLPQAPSLYSPFVNPTLAIERRNDVLLKMKEQKYITDSEYKAARNTPLQIIQPGVNIKAPHFVFHVKSELENEYGSRMVEEGGLKVTTTLDLDIQKEAEKILKEELERQKYLNVSNGAIMVTKPSTGEILAMVGSVDYNQQPYGAFNVTTADRQPGSSLKPLLYALALEKGYTAASIIDDSPTTFIMPGADPYRPVNYDGRSHGRVTMRIALANSYNLPAVRTLYNVGIEAFVNHMKQLGITSWNDPSRYVLPMALGGVEVKMIDLVSAYGTLADEGYKVPISGILNLKDSRDDTIFQLTKEKTKVLDDGVAYIISDILSDNQARTLTFGPGSQLEIPGYKVAVKTGTTDSKRDNWAVGYTPEFLVAVWIGNNDNTVMNPAIESGSTGASSLWHKVMEYLLKNKAQQPNTWFTQPENIVEKNCFNGRPEFFIRGTENVTCSLPSPTSAAKPTPKQQPGRRAEYNGDKEQESQVQANQGSQATNYVNP